MLWKYHRLFWRGIFGRQRFHFVAVESLRLSLNLLQLFGIGSLAPFLAILANPSLIDKSKHLRPLYKWMDSWIHFDSRTQFVLLFGTVSVSVIVLSIFFKTALDIYKQWLTQTLHRLSSGRLFGYYMSESTEFHLKHHSSDLLRRITMVHGLTVVWARLPFSLSGQILFALMMLVGLFYIDPLMLAIVGSTLATIILIYHKMSQSLLTGIAAEKLEIGKEMVKNKQEGIHGQLEIRMQGLEQNQVREHMRLAQSVNKRQLLSSIITSTLNPMISAAIVLLTFTAVIILIDEYDAEIVFARISIFMLISYKLLGQFIAASGLIMKLRSSLPQVELIEEDYERSLRWKLRGDSLSKDVNAIKSFDKVEFRGVCYRYPESDEDAVTNLDFSLTSQENIAFVGPSGSGKTTTARLLMGLLQPQKGKVMVDGRPLPDPAKSWWKAFGYVPQSTFFFQGSIRENLALGSARKSIDDNRLYQALEEACLTPLVESLPNGLDSDIGEHGAKLSGGQSQRLAIARVLVRHPKILVFDEATSSLDLLTESQIVKTLKNLTGKHLIVTIAHRLTTFKNADRLFLFDQGRVIDSGSFNELLQRSELFQMLVGELEEHKKQSLSRGDNLSLPPGRL